MPCFLLLKILHTTQFRTYAIQRIEILHILRFHEDLHELEAIILHEKFMEGSEPVRSYRTNLDFMKPPRIGSHYLR